MSFFKDQRGQAAVEAAILMPFLLFLLLGMFVVAYWLNSIQVVTAAAREGARTAALTGKWCQAEGAVLKMVQVINNDPAAFDIDIPNPLPGEGSSVMVKVRYRIPFGFNYVKMNYEQSAKTAYPFSTATGQAVARMEMDPPANQPGC